jgi:hypothetical protein
MVVGSALSYKIKDNWRESGPSADGFEDYLVADLR